MKMESGQRIAVRDVRRLDSNQLMEVMVSFAELGRSVPWEIPEAISYVGDFHSFEVYRYAPSSELEREQLKKLRDALPKAYVKYVTNPYASASTLLDLAVHPLPEWLRPFIERKISEHIPQNDEEGEQFYCTQLVLKLYEDAGIPLTEASASTARVTPNDMPTLTRRLVQITSNAQVNLNSEEISNMMNAFDYILMNFQRDYFDQMLPLTYQKAFRETRGNPERTVYEEPDPAWLARRNKGSK
jgi:hypothetical protein